MSDMTNIEPTPEEFDALLESGEQTALTVNVHRSTAYFHLSMSSGVGVAAGRQYAPIVRSGGTAAAYSQLTPA